MRGYIETFKAKWVNSDYIQYGVNLLRLGGFLLCYTVKIFFNVKFFIALIMKSKKIPGMNTVFIN